MNLKNQSLYQRGFHRLFLLLGFFIISSGLKAQHNNLNWEYQRFFVDSFIENSSISSFDYSYLRTDKHKETVEELAFKNKGKITSWLLNSHFLEKKTKDYSVIIDPLFDFGYGAKSSDDPLIRMSKGIFGLIQFKDKIEIGTYMYNGFESADQYIEDWAHDNLVFPGFGGVKSNLGYLDYLSSGGYINYKHSKYATFSAGHGKNKIGEGYRSLMLSDAVHNYPYVRSEFNIWRFNYTVILGQFTRFDNPVNTAGLRQKKNGVFHNLETRILDNLKVTFFEGVVWGPDSLNSRGFEFNYLNPFVSLRPVEYAIGSPDNMIIGVGGKWVIKKRVKLYTQFIMDEFKLSELSAGNNWWGNKYGTQVGMDVHDLFNVKGLNYLLEFNSVRPFTYSHFNVTQNYGHLQQSLAHPAGANFNELLTHVHYRKNRWLTSLQVSYKEQGFEESDAYAVGQDINISYENRIGDYNQVIGQGLNSKQVYSSFQIGYLINPKSNLIFDINYINRYQNIESKIKNEGQIFFGLRTSFFNIYRDF